MIKKVIPKKYIYIVYDTYREVNINVMTCGGATKSKLAFIKAQPLVPFFSQLT